MDRWRSLLYRVTNNAAVAAINLQLDAPNVGLEARTSDLTDQVATLEQKTTDSTRGSFTGTTFARRVQVANNGASAGASSVYLGSSDLSTFLYGIAASAPITSSSGISEVSSLLANASDEVSDDLIIDNGPVYISRSQVANTKKLVLYDNNTGNYYDFLGLFTSQSVGKSYFNNEIGGTGGAFRWHYGKGLGNSRVKFLEIDKTAFTSQAPTISFLNSQTGGST
jgi:hypothetical protein